MRKITKRGLKIRKTWIEKQKWQYKCECRGHREIISPNDCLCSPHDAEDLGYCKRTDL